MEPRRRKGQWWRWSEGRLWSATEVVAEAAAVTGRRSGRVALLETSEKSGHSPGKRRMVMGRGRWSEMKASVSHNNGGGGHKKRAAGRGRVAFWECRGSQATVWATTMAAAARRRGRLREEELHFGNAREVRPRSGWRRMVMGRGRWSETKASVATATAAAARRRGRPGEEELHFGNAREVRLRSRRRSKAIGRGRWSEMKTPISHNDGGGG